MAIFKTNFSNTGNEEEIDFYYEKASEHINLLLKKYSIRNAEGTFEQVSALQLKSLLSLDDFFQATPLKTIFADQKRQFVPQEITHAYQSIISNPPKIIIKASFLNTFVTLLKIKGWDKSLSAYFEKEYHTPVDEVIILEGLEDFSLNFGVYRATFFLKSVGKTVTVFLKKTDEITSCNELFYFHLQKKLLSTARDTPLPFRLLNSEQEELLLSPVVQGTASDITLSTLFQMYKKADHNGNDRKLILKKSLEILIEAFIQHAVLGDLLGRNDRHLENSFLAFFCDGKRQEDHLQEENLQNCVNSIVTNKMAAISLIDIDLKWLLGEKNADWALVDIDFGLSELNLLSLLPEFNDYDTKLFEKRKEYVTYYFNAYCHTLKAILDEKESLFSTLKKFYPSNVWEKKYDLLQKRISILEKSNEPIIELFKRYLLNYRLRLLYKTILMELEKTDRDVLEKTDLLNCLPPRSNFGSTEFNVLLQLQCFRGVLSEKDIVTLDEKNRISWENLSKKIEEATKKLNPKLFLELETKKLFIIEETKLLLDSISLMETTTQDLKKYSFSSCYQ